MSENKAFEELWNARSFSWKTDHYHEKGDYLDLYEAGQRHIPEDVEKVLEAVIDFQNQMRVQALEHKLLPAEYDFMCTLAREAIRNHYKDKKPCAKKQKNF